jgi:hypothetical protein
MSIKLPASVSQVFGLLRAPTGMTCQSAGSTQLASSILTRGVAPSRRLREGATACALMGPGRPGLSCLDDRPLGGSRPTREWGREPRGCCCFESERARETVAFDRAGQRQARAAGQDGADQGAQPASAV